MSRRTRIRRFNRLHEQGNPATRDMRLSLSDVLSRRLRSPLSNSLDRLRDNLRTKDKEINQPAERLRRMPTPLFDRGRRAAIRRANRLVANSQNTGLISVGEHGKLQVDLPHNHPVCVKRRERREVMFASRRTGKGAGRQKKPRIPVLTVRCK